MADGRVRRRLAVVLGVAAIVGVLGGCGDDGDDDPVARGRAIAEDVGCTACHSTGTDDRLGPGWGGIWGTERELVGGGTVVVDEEYLRRSIAQPDAEVVTGFTTRMPRVPLTDEEIDDLTSYLREVTGGRP